MFLLGWFLFGTLEKKILCGNDLMQTYIFIDNTMLMVTLFYSRKTYYLSNPPQFECYPSTHFWSLKPDHQIDKKLSTRAYLASNPRISREIGRFGGSSVIKSNFLPLLWFFIKAWCTCPLGHDFNYYNGPEPAIIRSVGLGWVIRCNRVIEALVITRGFHYR